MKFSLNFTVVFYKKYIKNIYISIFFRKYMFFVFVLFLFLFSVRKRNRLARITYMSNISGRIAQFWKSSNIGPFLRSLFYSIIYIYKTRYKIYIYKTSTDNILFVQNASH